MIAKELISDSLTPVSSSDTIKKILDRMAEFRVNHLPVVNKSEFAGILSEDDIPEITNQNTSLEELSIPLINIAVTEAQHAYDVLRMFYEHKLSIIPVVDEMKNYLGAISINKMMESVAVMTSAGETGGIILLEIDNRSNSLAHVAQIVESNNVQILSSYVQSFPDSTRLEITLKLNRADISAVIAALVRYEYTIKATFNDIRNDNTQDRYDQLMNYLDI